jgi:putative PIG3 family NAD(P)H quinone oxidoreductase
MKAIIVDDQKKLLWQETETPEVNAGEVRIRVRATAVNRADLVQRAGFYPPPVGASEILGLECAGEIESVGEGVTRWKKGDRVCALLAGGGYGEMVVCPAGHVLPIPEKFSFEEGAALAEVYSTAWYNIFMLANLQPEEKVLLHAGASGVGTAATQLCKAFKNPCFVTVGSQEKLDQCIQFGAQGGANRHETAFVDKAKEWSEGKGFDVILDPIGGSYLPDNIKTLNRDGRLILIGVMGGAKAEINLIQVLMKRIRLMGSTLRSQSVESKNEIIASVEKNVWPLLESGEISPVIDSTIEISKAEEAFKLIESNQTIGKVILRMP